MEGLLFLALIIWVISKGSKKKKKVRKRASAFTEVRKAEKTSPERVKQLWNEMERKMREAADTQAAYVISEGESAESSAGQEAAFRGSLQMDSTEGECICDPELEHERKVPEDKDSVYVGEIGRSPLVDFTAQGMMQGMVMSEILARPSQRMNRRLF